MDDTILQKEPNLEDMKKAILKEGGLFYQYRPCHRDIATIYDIENIRHGVVYSQTPLNMNDPFDSMIGFSAKKFYDDCISMLIDSLQVNDEMKIIVVLLLKYKAFGEMTEFILL